MINKSYDPVKEKKEQVAYALFYYFLASCVLKVFFGIIGGSKCLLVAGIFSLFGVFIGVVSLIRIVRAHPGRTGRIIFNPDKLEFIIVLGASIIITLSTCALLFSIGHMVFFHTLYPPSMSAAWVALITAKLSLVMMFWYGKKASHVYEIDAKEVNFALTADFILSVVTVIGVVIARNGSTILDYACAILAAFFLILYGVSFLKGAFKGLMDASGDEEIIEHIRGVIKKAQPRAVLEVLRVNRSGHLFEIMVTLGVKGDVSMKEALIAGRKIREALRTKFLRPHELLLGLKAKEAA
ncbi:MAG: cation transporter [Candidatus Omnitrophica bacterium]|nr:cation transporter [Candidatus Omnitrophota bacterium]